MTVLLLALFGAAACVAWRGATARRVDRAYASRQPRAADGIVVGAESFTLVGASGRALLLLHGSGDTPQTLRFLARRLNAAGYTVHVPLLPGHGRRPRAFAQVSAAAYLTAARDALSHLRGTYGWIGVAGLSMGGALASQLAAESADVRVLILLVPYLIPPPAVAWAARTAPLWGLVQPYLDGRGEESVQDPAARGRGYAYGVFSPAALRAMVQTAMAGRAALARVTVPTLVINSRQDNRIPAALAEQAIATLQAPTQREWVSGCGHVITVDYCKDTVADLMLAFLAHHAK